MNIVILYRTHSIRLDALPSVPRFIAILVSEIMQTNPDFKFSIGCPLGGILDGATIYSIGKSYTEDKFYNLQRRVYRYFGWPVPPGPVNKRKVAIFFNSVGAPDIVICCKTLDIALAKRYAPKSKIIWWHLGLEKFDPKEFTRAIYQSDLIIYTGSVTYNYIYDQIMPAAFPTPVLIAHGPYAISDMIEAKALFNKQASRKQLHIDESELIMLHVGGNRPEKGLKVIKLALQLLTIIDKKVRFISIGHEKETTEVLANGIVIESKAFFNIKYLYKYYIATDIGLIAPLWKEPGPAVFIEMLFFNTAVIAANSAGVPEMMGKKECALTIEEPNNVLDWTEKIQQLIDDGMQREKLTALGEAQAIDFFHEPVIENWVKAMRALTL